MELHHHLAVLRKGWLVIVAAVVIAIGAGLAFNATQTPLYSSSTRLLVTTQSIDSVADLSQGNTFGQQKVATYADLATTPIVLQPVIDELALPLTAGELAEQITATSSVGTTLLDISVTAESGQAAADIANALSRSLTSVVEGIEASATSTGVSLVRITSVEPANAPTSPSSPNLPLTIALAALVGLALGYLVSFLREVLDKRIRSREDVARITSAPLIGLIPFNPDSTAHPLVVSEDSSGVLAESFRTLRTNLRFLGLASSKRIYVVTSARPGDGKSTTAANLALALADTGDRTLLIDADLRSPSVADYLGTSGAVGLTDVLIGTAEPADLIQPWGTGSLCVLAAGQVPPNPSELIGSTQMADLLDLLSDYFDAIIIDTPPLLPVSDAAVLSRLASATILVAAMGQTHTNQVRDAIQMLETVGTTVSGIVLSKVPLKGSDAYGYGAYGAYGAYGKAYGAATPQQAQQQPERPQQPQQPQQSPQQQQPQA